MATTTSTGNLSGTIGQAIAAAKENPQIKKMIEDQLDTRKLAMKAAKTGGKAYMSRRALRKAAAAGKSAGEGDQPEGNERRGRKPRRGGKGKFVLLLIAIGVAGAFANKSSREKMLDLLFGAEEEFVYTSTTTTASVNGAS